MAPCAQMTGERREEKERVGKDGLGVAAGVATGGVATGGVAIVCQGEMQYHRKSRNVSRVYVHRPHVRMQLCKLLYSNSTLSPYTQLGDVP